MFDFNQPITKDTNLYGQWFCGVKDVIVYKQLSGSGVVRFGNTYNYTIFYEIDGVKNYVNTNQTIDIEFVEGEEKVVSLGSDSADAFRNPRDDYRRTNVALTISGEVDLSLSIPSVEPFLQPNGYLPSYSFFRYNMSQAVWDESYTTYEWQRCPVVKLEDGSFSDTDKIVSTGSRCFECFIGASDRNFAGDYRAFAVLPEGSFSFANLESIGSNFGYGFLSNVDADEVYVPAGAFHFPKLKSVNNNSCMSNFCYMMKGCKKMTFPDNFMRFDVLEETGEYGTLMDSSFSGTLPSDALDEMTITFGKNSFIWPKLRQIGGSSFARMFQNFGKLEYTLPTGSFNFDNVTLIQNYAFTSMLYQDSNYGGLRSLPAGSFNFRNAEVVGNAYGTPFENFGGNYTQYIIKGGNEGVEFYCPCDGIFFGSRCSKGDIIKLRCSDM